MLQTALVLAALWMITDPIIRAVMLSCIVAATALLTYALQPYTLNELINLDMLVSGVVVFHIALRAAAPSSTPVSIILLILHALVVLRLVWAVLRGTSHRARVLASYVRAGLASCFPQLKAEDRSGGSLEASSLPGLGELLAAVGAALGCAACRRQKQIPAQQLSGAAQWGGVVAAAAAAVSAAKAASASGDISSAEGLEAAAVKQAAGTLNVSRTLLDDGSEALAGLLCGCCASSVRQAPEAFGTARTVRGKPGTAGKGGELALVLADVVNGSFTDGKCPFCGARNGFRVGSRVHPTPLSFHQFHLICFTTEYCIFSS
jgi:hypothetical protein